MEGARSDGRVRIAWETKKSGSGLTAVMVKKVRWVATSSLSKVGMRRSPRLVDSAASPPRRGIFGVELPEMAVHEKGTKNERI